jgi:hypothetical protein
MTSDQVAVTLNLQVLEGVSKPKGWTERKGMWRRWIDGQWMLFINFLGTGELVLPRARTMTSVVAVRIEGAPRLASWLDALDDGDFCAAIWEAS